MTASKAGPAGTAGNAGNTRLILLTLAAGQFLMALDSSVMNVSIATVAEDIGTTVSGMQGAITAYTLVMAMLMISGGKVGALIGRKRAFMIGCVIYGLGSFTTAIAPNLPVLMLGWSFLEGVGAALILPAIVALVASNFDKEQRPAAYGLVAAAAAVAIAVGPLIGGAATTFFSWRWVFAGEVVVVFVILLLARRIADAPRTTGRGSTYRARSCPRRASGCSCSACCGRANGGGSSPSRGPSWFHLSPVVWLVLAGLSLVWLFFRWETRLVARGVEPLVDPELLRNKQLSGGLTMFFFQYLVQMGVFFVVPLYLSVALGLSALHTGALILPLSITLLAAAIGIPKFRPNASPRRVVRFGILVMFAGAVILMAALTPDSGPEVVTVPMLLIGLGIGALASQLGAVTVSAVPDEQTAEVGGIQNTVTNLGASIGTAVAGSIMIAVLTGSFLATIDQNPAIPAEVKSQAHTALAGTAPFLSDEQLTTALEEAGTDPAVAQAALDANEEARIDGLRAALGILALAALVALFFTQRIPATQPGAARDPAGATS